MEFLFEYGLFLAKAATLVIAVLFVVAAVAGLSHRGKKGHDGEIEVKHLNRNVQKMRETIEHEVYSKDWLKQHDKEQKKKEKQEQKKHKQEKFDEAKQSRVYLLDFDGDIRASGVNNLRQEITAVLAIAKPEDEVVIRLESPGGMVHGYGLAASQLRRIRDKGIPLTVCVDKVAASGGYMMACIGSKILAAPFAVIGSIGVVAQLPNFHRLLKKHDIDFEVLTAGEYKRTLTIFGENTEKGRQKFLDDLEETHQLFKSFVSENRSQVDIEEVAKGEIWYGSRALEKNLIDLVQTSDDYILEKCNEAEVYQVKYHEKKSIAEKFGFSMATIIETVSLRLSKFLLNTPTK